MIDIKFNKKIYSIKNTIKEYNIDEFEDICTILNHPDKDKIDKWLDILTRLNVPTEIIDNLSKKEFFTLIREFDLNLTSTTIKKEIVINKVKYKAYDKDFKLRLKDVLLFENMVTLNKDKFLAEIIAILYKSKSEDNVKFDLDYITNKAKMIRKEVKADIAIPILNLISATLLKNIKTYE